MTIQMLESKNAELKAVFEQLQNTPKQGNAQKMRDVAKVTNAIDVVLYTLSTCEYVVHDDNTISHTYLNDNHVFVTVKQDLKTTIENMQGLDFDKNIVLSLFIDMKKIINDLAIIFEQYIDNESVYDFSLNSLTNEDMQSVRTILSSVERGDRNLMIDKAVKKACKMVNIR